MKKLSAIFLLILPLSVMAWAGCPVIRVSEEIDIVKLSERAYVHVSRAEMGAYGMVSSNGLIVLDKGEAFLFDTPATESQTEKLVEWISDSLGAKITTFVPNHWHGDCMGGIGFLHGIGVKSHANRMTVDISREKGLPQPQNGFRKKEVLKLNGLEIVCYYPGAAHSVDNIVVWIPSEKILFAGCMVKSADSDVLGNTDDGDKAAYPKTIGTVIKKFSEAETVIPGHGPIGGFELLEHTLKLAENGL